MLCEDERVRLVSVTAKIDTNEPVLVFLYTSICINPIATEKSNFKTVKVKLPYLLYLTIVRGFVLSVNIVSINTYTTILIHAFLILSFGVERVSIYVIPLVCHNGEYRTKSQLFELFTYRSI
ncbi:hypothetical protein GQ55_2G401000 [Panicum hallii var. hallii]|uniref:Uncharacterized protein n=1 Tax=Panicum hallii var. hallii TaxID=1504633 RepID=A0A2T7ENU2_9POAL|nr:hypothetical protein GQ55_2G113900 [Panicum hallii var. hallii]PUZ72531.1 hypothetical protein GQ55_2G401000 [Panicum hallii var. hallii]